MFVALQSSATAQALSVHFNVGTTNSVTSNAGVFAASSWNNVTNATTLIVDPLLSDGSTGTGITLAFPTYGSFTFAGGGYSGGIPGTFSGTSGTGAGFNSLYRSNIDPRGGATANTAAVRIEGLSILPGFSSGYTLYVYTDGNNLTASRIGQYALYAGSASAPSATFYALDAANSSYTDYVLSTATSQAEATIGANYIAFSGLSADAVTISALGVFASDGQLRAPINGIQIVPNSLVPEPSSSLMMFLGLGGFGYSWHSSQRRAMARSGLWPR